VTLADTRPAQVEAAEPSTPPAAGAAAPPVAAPAEAHRRLPYFPGLDGLRGVAVLVVLLFHAGFSWAVGGYLGVSTFFTLSGFLITSLLLAERTTTKSIDLGGFWVRRIRRLMPASVTALALAVLMAHFAGTASQQRNIGGDVISALADVANWHFIFAHQSYADLFSAPSPVLHFWSLAIEEQFYLVFPVLAFVLLAALRWDRHRLGRVFVGLMAVSLGLTLFAGFSDNRIYYGTDTRSFELLAGGLLAVLIYSRRVTSSLARPGQRRTIVAVCGAVALAVCALLWIDTPVTSGWLYDGGLAGYSVLSVAIILATIIPFGPVARIMANRPLRRIGMLSFGVYAYHWPIFLWIDQLHTHLNIWPLTAIKFAVTWVVAVLSYHHLERPIRHGELPFGLQRKPWSRRVQIGWAVPSAFLIVGASALLVTAAAPPPLFDFAAAQRTLDSLGAGKAPRHPTAPGTLPIARVAAFGDSTGLVVGSGINLAAPSTGGVEEVTGGAWVGCGLGIGGLYRATNDMSYRGSTTPACNAWPTTYARVIEQNRPDLAVMLDAPWDVMDRKLIGDNKWRSFGDPVYDHWFFQEMLRAVDVLSKDGAMVVWLTSPQVSNIPSRVDRLNELIEELPSARPGKVVVLDFAGYLASLHDDAKLRPDHVHLSGPASVAVAHDWLIPNLVKIWRQLYESRGGHVLATPTTLATAPTVPSN
jgi:peptidoglycan/LPS O-acetylase OafA/YrhL